MTAFAQLLLLAIAAALLLVAEAWKWSGIETTDDSVSQRFGAATAVWPQSTAGAPDRLLICGGAVGNASSPSQILDDCSVLLPGLNGAPWSLKQVVKSSSGVFSARRDFVAVASGSYLFLYGGRASSDEPFAPSLSAASLSAGSSIATPVVLQLGGWVALDATFTGDIPTARYGHAAVLSPLDPLTWIIFGGAAVQDGSLLDDLVVLDLRTNGSNPVSPTFNFATSQITVTGARPSARKYSALAAFGTNTVFLVGGQLGSGSASSQVFKLTMGSSTTWTWASLPTVYSIPVYGHSLVATTVPSTSEAPPPPGGLLVLYGAVTTGGARPPSVVASGNGGVLTISLVDFNWRCPDIPQSSSSPSPVGGGGVVGGGALLAGSGLLDNMQGVDSSDDGATRLVVFGGALSSSSSYSSSGFATLEDLGVATAQPPKKSNLPIVLGGVAVGLFLLLAAAGLVWWRRGTTSRPQAKTNNFVPRLKSTSLGTERHHLLSSPASVFYGASNGLGTSTANSTMMGGGGGDMSGHQGYVYGSPATVRNGGLVRNGATAPSAIEGSFFGGTPFSEAPSALDEQEEEPAAATGKGKRKKEKRKKSRGASVEEREAGLLAGSELPQQALTASASAGLVGGGVTAYTQRLLHHQFFPPPPISEGPVPEEEDARGGASYEQEEEDDGTAAAAAVVVREDELRF